MSLGPFSHLAAGPGVDWQHVDLRLLSALDRAARQLGVTITLTSGFRTPAHSAAVGGYSNDPHTRGVAVDALVNGQPVASYPGMADELRHVGLEPGTSSDFYRGRPDPVHVQIPGSGVNKSVRAQSTLAGGGLPTGGGAAYAATKAGASSSSSGPSPMAAAASGCLVYVVGSLAFLGVLAFGLVDTFS